jgi:FAD/FMN-containing dehydrogenase/Fe-S oxidoreductase
MNDLEYELRRIVEGDVRFDKLSRLLYSTDASMYQVEPIGVVIPRHTDDIQAVLELTNRLAVPVLPRGGGTSLTGQTVNYAVVLDYSVHLNQVLEVNQEELWARVQPGVVQDVLNQHLKPAGLLFGPDTSTSSRATLGGMIGNNSGGSHSIAYGLTIDHLIELTALLSDGSRAVFGEITPQAFAEKLNLSGLEGEIYRQAAHIKNQYRDEILARYPKYWRRVCGYNLDELVKDRPLNMARLIAGSEGTLLNVIEAKVRLVKRPKKTALVVVHYSELQEALESSQAILETGPYSVELTDKMILDLARENLELSQRMGFIEGDPSVILGVEYAGESDAEVRSKVEALATLRARHRFGYAAHTAYDPDEQKAIWNLRKKGLGLLMGIKGDAKPVAFVEDTAVDPKNLPFFIPRFREILARHDVVGAYYGHCSVGCLHIRPIINLKASGSLARVKAIADEITDLVMEFGGAISSEHGDGRARSPYLERVYGATLVEAFRQLKRAFDPKNLMNPGNIVAPSPLTDHLRYGPEYKTREIDTILDFSRQGGVAASVEMCNGAGVCRKTLEGTMCPSYMATRDEEHSTRGRANALRAVLSGLLPASDLTSQRLYDVMDLCLECKACKAECPANVDMAKLKYEFLHHYYRENGLPLRNRIFGRIAEISEMACRFSPVTNLITHSQITRRLMDYFLGIDSRREFPSFASETFTDWFKSREPPQKAPRGTVVLFNDTFTTYNTPQVGQAAVELLEGIGYRVELVDKKCCGRPLISKGMLPEAKEHAEWNVAELKSWVEYGAPIIGIEPSCLLTLRDEYPDLQRNDDSKKIAASSYLLEEFLLNERAHGLSIDFRPEKRRALLHGHCHQKAMVGTGPTVQVLRWANFEVIEIDSGCCGMAGSFGFEKEHYDISISLGKRRLAPAIDAEPSTTEIVATGISCRQQIEHLTGRRAKHPVELLLDALDYER